MSSNIFTKMGLANPDVGVLILVLLLLVIVLLALVIWLMRRVKHVEERYRKFMQGAKPRSLESQIQELIKTVSDLQGTALDQGRDIKTLFSRNENNFQKMGLVKYDAYSEMGGKLSFCLAMLDEKNNGFLMNSVHSSTGCYSYTKRIRRGKCNIELSPEEQEALTKAMVGGQGKGQEDS